MNDAVFRYATEEDAVFLAQVESLCFKDPWTKDMLLSEMREPHATFVLCLSQDIPIGYFSFLHIIDELHILNVAVLPEYQGGGYGRALVGRLIKEALYMGARAITLEVRQSNVKAIALYESVGFQLAGTRPHYYMDKENALIYWKEL